MSVRIEARGMAEMSRAFKRLGPEYIDELKETNRKVAELVAERATRRMRRGNRLARKVAKQRQRGGPIRGQGQQRKAVVAIGGKRPDLYRTMHGLEWGALRTRYRSDEVFGRWVGNQYSPSTSPGRFVGAELATGDYLDTYLDAVEELFDRLWPKGRGKPVTIAELSPLSGVSDG